jgi:DNA-binding transcriptional LysR family regulator
MDLLSRMWDNIIMDLNELLVFARVVEAGGFTAAAAALGMPKSTVSRKVSDLEERLQARLLQRTTRRLSLTDVGRTYYQYCARIVGELEEAERAVSSLQGTPRGRLRVTAPLNFGFLGPILSDYLGRYPEVQLELVCTDRVVDLVEERFDVGIRAGVLADSTLIARNLGSERSLLVASPSYLARRGRPGTPEELTAHDGLLFGAGLDRAHLRLQQGPRRAAIAVPPRLVVNDFEILHAGALAGLGIALLPIFRCAADVRAGTLERVLEPWDPPPIPIHAVYPSSRHLSPKVKRFLDHLQERMSPPPWELEPAA